MKRKIALLVAATMALAAVPMNIFAATTLSSTDSYSVFNSIVVENDNDDQSWSNYNPAIGYTTASSQQTVAGAYDARALTNIITSSYRVARTPNWVRQSSDLIMEFNSGATAGAKVNINLSSGAWAFDNANTYMTPATTYGPSVAEYRASVLANLKAQGPIATLGTALTNTVAAYTPFAAPANTMYYSDAELATIADLIVNNATTLFDSTPEDTAVLGVGSAVAIEFTKYDPTVTLPATPYYIQHVYKPTATDRGAYFSVATDTPATAVQADLTGFVKNPQATYVTSGTYNADYGTFNAATKTYTRTGFHYLRNLDGTADMTTMVPYDFTAPTATNNQNTWVSATTGTTKAEVPYTLYMYDDQNAELTINQAVPSNVAGNYFLRVPLVVWINEDDVTVTTTPDVNSGLTAFSRKVYTVTSKGEGSSTADLYTARLVDNYKESSTTGGDVVDGTYAMALDDIVIAEKSVNAYKEGMNVIDLMAPTGIYFDLANSNTGANNSTRPNGTPSATNTATVSGYVYEGLGTIPGILKNTATNYNTIMNYIDSESFVTTSYNTSSMTIEDYIKFIYAQVGGSFAGSSEWNVNTTSYVDTLRASDTRLFNAVRIYTTDITRSTSMRGALALRGIKLIALDTSPIGDIKLMIYVNDKNHNDDPISLLVATRTERGLSLVQTNADDVVPTLTTGDYVTAANSATDKFHRTVNFTFREKAADSWWPEQKTIFTLPDGVKIRKVTIDTDDITTGIEGTYKIGSQTFDKRVVVDDSTITLNNLTVANNATAAIDFKLWVSVDPQYVGDIAVTVNASAYHLATENNELYNYVKDLVIAHTIQPVTAAFNATNINIGFQKFDVSDITLNETQSNIWEQNKSVTASVTDGITTDIKFTEGVKYEVNTKESGLEIANFRVVDGVVAFDVRTASYKKDAEGNKVPGSVKLTNVVVHTDRTVPEGRFDLLVGGAVVAANYTGYVNPTGTVVIGSELFDTFNTKGVRFPGFINVVTPAQGGLASEVKVSNGSATIVVDGVESEMVYATTTGVNAVPFISEANDSMLVPVRFIATALGAQVGWSSETNTVSVISGDRTVGFVVGSPTMTVNGVPQDTVTADGRPIEAMNKDGVVYVPMRALGTGLGISVSYDEATQTAIFNQKQDLGYIAAAPVVAAAPAAETPASEEAPAASEEAPAETPAE